MTENISMAFVGDISFGDNLLCQGFGVRSVIRQKGGDFLFAEVRKILMQNDVVFGNLEGILSKQGENPNSLKSMDMRGEPECAHALASSGFNVINMANNHIMQHGLAPFQETVERLQSFDIQIVGLKGESPWHSRPVILHKKNIKIGWLGYAFESDRYYAGELPYAFGTDDLIVKDIERLKPRVDILIVSNHWGLETIDRPSALTIRLARNMADHGADIIIGHHPHVLQGIEYYKGKIIAYSLGNFIFDIGGWNKNYSESVIFRVNCVPGQKLECEIIPVLINSFWQPVPLYGKEKEQLLARMEELSLKIRHETEGTVEGNALKYYKEYLRVIQKNRINAYRYFISNFGRYKKKFVLQQLAMTCRSRLEDFGAFVSD